MHRALHVHVLDASMNQNQMVYRLTK